ncbi:MAG: S-layer homology domain-containing protein [Oscillospiraceae bacterium]|nr:S-layer homology domain-containing protein [Oscillospiraceae bacterium]
MRKRIVSVLLCVCLTLSLFVIGASASDTRYKVLIDPVYEDASSFSDGLAAVKVNGKWGFIDESGEMVIQAKYDYVTGFNDGIALAAYDGGGAVDYVPWFAEFYDYYLYVYMLDSTGNETLLNIPGSEYWDYDTEWVPLVIYYSGTYTDFTIWNFGCSGDVVWADGHAFRTDGSYIEMPDTSSFCDPYYNTYRVLSIAVDGVIPCMAVIDGTDAYGQCFYMDAEGNVLKVFESCAETEYEISDDNGELDGYGGQGITYVYAPDPDTGLIVAYYVWWKDGELSEYLGLLESDSSGSDLNWRVEPNYETGFTGFRFYANGSFFTDGYMSIQKADGSWYLINEKGEFLDGVAYDLMGTFNEGLCPVCLDGQWYYVDTEGNRYGVAGPDGGEAQITMATQFNGRGVAAVYDKLSGKAYCIQADVENGLLTVISGSDRLSIETYIPDYQEGDDELGTISAVSEIITIQEDGKYGFARLTLVTDDDIFTDVASEQYYYNAVYWAYQKGVTTGTTDTTFSPDESCTRAQFVTFLWRLAGEPEPQGTQSPFSDVKNSGGDAVYYKAILWAYENGVTNGTSKTTFSPNQPIERADAVTLLYRYEDEPTVSGTNVFTDVSSGEYYTSAILWAYKTGVTNGTSDTTFSPTNVCIRADMVCFLYRWYAGTI